MVVFLFVLCFSFCISLLEKHGGPFREKTKEKPSKFFHFIFSLYSFCFCKLLSLYVFTLFNFSFLFYLPSLHSHSTSSLYFLSLFFLFAFLLIFLLYPLSIFFSFSLNFLDLFYLLFRTLASRRISIHFLIFSLLSHTMFFLFHHTVLSLCFFSLSFSVHSLSTFVSMFYLFFPLTVSLHLFLSTFPLYYSPLLPSIFSLYFLYLRLFFLTTFTLHFLFLLSLTTFFIYVFTLFLLK